MAGMYKHRARGFTLIELMIVVAIIGILASVAIPSFINYQLTSKRAEAYANLSSIAKAQKSYYAEFNTYVAVPAEPAFGLGGVPPGTIKRDSTPIDGAFAAVGWKPEGDVFYDYDTVTPGAPGSSCTCAGPCFTAAAYGDLDGDGALSILLVAHPDTGGGFCDTFLGGPPVSPPINAGGRVFDQVARAPFPADDF